MALMIICQETSVGYNTFANSYSYMQTWRVFVSNVKHQKTNPAVSTALVSFHFLPTHNCLRLLFNSTPLSQGVIWKESHLKSKNLYLKHRNPLFRVWRYFYLSTRPVMTLVHQLPKYFLSWDPYSFFAITQNNSSFVLISWRRLLFSIRLHQ